MNLQTIDLPLTDLRFATTRVHGRNVVAVSGDIDIVTAPDLHSHLCDAIDASTGNASRVVMVDLSAVTFMDARGLSALISAEAHARDRGARLHLTALPAKVTRLLQITGLDHHFDLCPTSQEDRLP